MTDAPSDLFAALGQPNRLAIFRLLARRAPDGVPAGEIAEAVGIKPNVASVHLAILARAGLIAGARAGKQILYRIDLVRAGSLIDYLALDCCRGRPELCAPLTAAILSNPARQEPSMAESRIFNVLFICSGNSARSIMAEAILEREGGGKFRAFSAGTRPTSELNPLAVEKLASLGHDTSKLRSKNVAEFQTLDAPRMDFVFTVCDLAANEECPPWAGQPISGHWGMPDPVKVEGTMAERQLAFSETYRQLKHRISAFANLPVASLDRISLQREVDRIGRMDARTDA
ncbi:MAG: metalloregulator ArsR/SmtB family transcription factor [Rubrimonas sp.]|uniref:metalloregulator ArsR/SmtB family transcription factor n=1 Tax=Rubrimonas sp. TaxID=2036015 RepID=UPI002FDD1F6F